MWVIVMSIDTNVEQNVSHVVAVVDAKASAKADAVRKMSHVKAKGALPARRLPIGDGETASSRIEVVDDKHVKASFSFKLERDSKLRYGHTVLFDYSNCSMAEILTDATRSHVITVQRKLREMGEGALDATVYGNVDVKRELVDATRSTIDPEIRSLAAFAKAAKLSHDDARRYIDAIASGKLKL